MASLIYEVECELDPDVVADYDAWLPGHVRDVLACPGFLGATIEAPEPQAGGPPRRLIRYRLDGPGALDRYLENDATRLRTETAQRFGGRVRCVRRTLRPREDLLPAALERRCLDCGEPVTGRYCAACGQSTGAHVLSMREVLGDVTHSLLHLDSRVWRTLRLLVLRPGELTREFVAGRHQRYLPPFRLYLAISILYFALSALLPGTGALEVDAEGNTVIAPMEFDLPAELERELEAEGVSTDAARQVRSCEFEVTDAKWLEGFEQAVERACTQMRADGGKAFTQRFASTAPKLMFLFLPLIAAAALLFYWRPRRLYAEHLVLFLHNHAFTFLLLGTTELVGQAARLGPAGAGAAGVVELLLYAYLGWYVFRSMRVAYGQGRLVTTLKFLALAVLYFLLLGVTMLAGFVYTLYDIA